MGFLKKLMYRRGKYSAGRHPDNKKILKLYEKIQKEIIMTPYTEAVIQIITSIPPGKVMTYGQIASIAGSPRSARQVVRIIHSMSKKYSLPWHRIINYKGEIGIRDSEEATMQRLMLMNEGVEFTEEGSVDLTKFQFHSSGIE